MGTIPFERKVAFRATGGLNGSPLSAEVTEQTETVDGMTVDVIIEESRRTQRNAVNVDAKEQSEGRRLRIE